MAQKKPAGHRRKHHARPADSDNDHELKLMAAEFLDLWQVNLAAWSVDPDLPARLENHIKSLTARTPSGGRLK